MKSSHNFNVTIERLPIEQVYVCQEIVEQLSLPNAFMSPAYFRFLVKALPRTNFVLLLARLNGKSVGYLPTFTQLSVCRTRSVMNSSPFFGSHGGPVVLEALECRKEIQNELIQAAYKLAAATKVDTLTIVEQIFDPLDEMTNFKVIDDRIGQVTLLPKSKGEENVADLLMDKFHVKTRNAIRKGLKLNQRIEKSIDSNDLVWMQQVHAQSIASMGGLPKTLKLFAALMTEFPLGSGSDLWIGRIDGSPVSGLLTLTHGKVVEYFTPVVSDEFKNAQALSALIFHAMCNAVETGKTHWNWGGTWHSQEGVYRFKKRFGATDFPYRYFHSQITDQLTTMKASEASKQFSYFYTHRYP